MEDALELYGTDIEMHNFGFTEFFAEKAEMFEEVLPLRDYRQSQKTSREGNTAERK